MSASDLRNTAKPCQAVASEEENVGTRLKQEGREAELDPLSA